MSTAHRARNQFGPNTERAHTGEDYRYITGFLTSNALSVKTLST